VVRKDTNKEIAQEKDQGQDHKVVVAEEGEEEDIPDLPQTQVEALITLEGNIEVQERREGEVGMREEDTLIVVAGVERVVEVQVANIVEEVVQVKMREITEERKINQSRIQLRIREVLITDH